MKQRSFAIALVSQKAQRQIEQGHPWVYDTEIRSIQGAYENGDLVDIAGEKGTYLGTGFVSERSKIRIRMVSRNANDRFEEPCGRAACAMRGNIEKRCWMQLICPAAV